MSKSLITIHNLQNIILLIAGWVGFGKKELVHVFTSYCCFSAHSIFILLFLVTRSTLEKSTQTICQAQASGSYSVHMGQAREMDNHLHHLPQAQTSECCSAIKLDRKAKGKYTLYTLCNLLVFFLPWTVYLISLFQDFMLTQTNSWSHAPRQIWTQQTF